jgi:hypothetical protein
MPWKLKNKDEVWSGDTHELAGVTYTGATRTPTSLPLVWSNEEPKKAVVSSKPKKTKSK